MGEALYYQETEEGLFVRARGHITAAISTDLRELVLARLTRAPVPPVLGVDLSECDYMDSTFMGLLVGFHKRYKALTGRPLTIVRPTAECSKLLAGLGILKLMSVVTGPEPTLPDRWNGVQAVHSPSTEVLLTAHRNLSELSPENQVKFSALQSVLEQELKKDEKS